MSSAEQIDQLKSEVNELLVIVRNLTTEIISLRKENTLQKAELDIY